MELTKCEMEIMDVLWGTEQALSRSDILRLSTVKSWKDSSIHIMLNGLLAKNAIREAGVVKCKKTLGRTFRPTLTREQYFATNVFSYNQKPDMTALIAALLARPEMTPEALAQIRQLVNGD